MSTLHIVHRIVEGRLPASLPRCFAPGDGLLLTGDGVYAALTARGDLPTPCMALGDDVRARGLLPQWPGEVPLIDATGFVELCVSHAKSLSWA